MLLHARERLADLWRRAETKSSEMGSDLRVLGARIGNASRASGEHLSRAGSNVRDASSRVRERLQGAAGGVSAAAAVGVAAARWRVGEASWRMGTWLRGLQAAHRKGSGAAVIALLLCLGAGGVIAAVLAAGGKADVVGVNYTSRYVTVTGSNYVTVTTRTGVETRAATVTERGKRVVRTRVRTRVVKGPGGWTTLREEIPGPVQHVPGETKTVRGPTKTVTVTGPGQTVTEVVTEVVTVTIEVPVTVTEDGEKR